MVLRNYEKNRVNMHNNMTGMHVSSYVVTYVYFVLIVYSLTTSHHSSAQFGQIIWNT